MGKVRVIAVSEALRKTDAERFARKLREHFNGKYVFSGRYGLNGSRQHLPLYYVVRIPEKNEPLIDKHEMLIDRGEVLEKIRLTKDTPSAILREAE
ncbi:MAG: hypothetical protein ABSF91_13115 [Bacteroidota bacterium]|jgi:hypothetical protein